MVYRGLCQLRLWLRWDEVHRPPTEAQVLGLCHAFRYRLLIHRMGTHMTVHILLNRLPVSLRLRRLWLVRQEWICISSTPDHKTVF